MTREIGRRSICGLIIACSQVDRQTTPKREFSQLNPFPTMDPKERTCCLWTAVRRGGPDATSWRGEPCRYRTVEAMNDAMLLPHSPYLRFFGEPSRGPERATRLAAIMKGFIVTSTEERSCRSGLVAHPIHDYSKDCRRYGPHAANRLPESNRSGHRGQAPLGGHHPTRAKRVDLLGHIGQKGQHQETSH